MVLLPVGIDKFVEVDDEDFIAISFHSWSLNGGGYARTEIKGKLVLLQKFIAKRMGLDITKIIDHKDRNKSNYKRSNLREATLSQNMHNCKRQINNSLGYKGVRQFRSKYRSAIRNPSTGERIHLGTFNTIQEAAKAYANAALEFYGEYAEPEGE